MKCPICAEETADEDVQRWGPEFAHKRCVKAYSLGGCDARAAIEADKAQRVQAVWSTKKDFRWDGERQQHVPQLIVEFEPVPFDGPCNAKGWMDRDAVAALLASTPAPAQQEQEKELEPRMSRACLDAWDKSNFTAGHHDAVHPMFLEAFSAGFKAAQHQEQPQQEAAMQKLVDLSEELGLYEAKATKQERGPMTDEEVDAVTMEARDDLLDHIYEYGTFSEGSLQRVRKIAHAVERHHGIRKD